jgi:hypothetical protein
MPPSGSMGSNQLKAPDCRRTFPPISSVICPFPFHQ